MTEPPLKICNVCRGGGCDLCDQRGVGIPIEWLMDHYDDYEIVGGRGPGRYARERSEHEKARLKRQRKRV